MGYFKYMKRIPIASIELYLLLSLSVNLLGLGVLADTHSAPEDEVGSSSYVNACELDTAYFPMYCNCNNPDDAEVVKCGVWNSTQEEFKGPWDALGNLENLNFLEFNNRPERSLKQFPPSSLFHRLTKLTYFGAKLSQFERLPPYAFGNSSSLSEIALGDNMIQWLEKESFADLVNVSKINLGSNMIKEINRIVFVNLPTLQGLYLDRNRITVIHDNAFQELHNLEELDLQKNNLAVVARDVFYGLKKVTRLDLQGNMIEFLGDHVFAEMPLLHELDLHGNQIRSVSPKAFYGLESLGRLILKGNKIVSLKPSTFSQLGMIFLLDLRDNELDTLSEALIQPIYNNLKNPSMQLMIDGNRLMCDCRILWVQRLYKETSSDYVKRHFEHIQCDLFKTGEQKIRELHRGVAVSYSSNVTVFAAPPEETTTYSFDGSRNVLDLKPSDFKCHKESSKDQKDFSSTDSHQHDDATSGRNTNQNTPKEIGHRFPILSEKDKNILQSHHQSHIDANDHVSGNSFSSSTNCWNTSVRHYYLSLFFSSLIVLISS